MVYAKKYETMSTFVEVMQRKLWPLFPRTRCIFTELDFNDFHKLSKLGGRKISMVGALDDGQSR